MPRNTNGSAVRALREAIGITGRDFAERVGISPGYLTNIEVEKKQPAPAVARKLADALGVPLDAITYAVPDPRNAQIPDSDFTTHHRDLSDVA